MAEQMGLEAILSVYDNGFTSAMNQAERSITSFDKKVTSLSNNMGSALEKRMSSFGNTINDMGSKLTSSITKPAMAASTALAGITVGKGFGRLIGIDSARAKLQGLGHDAMAVEAIMDNALASVSGTAFAMEDAANTAATAVAAGVKPGKELTRYLSLTADAAAIAGTNMGEMGSIFNKIATSGIIQAEEMNQLGDRGIPIYQMLADEIGVTADQVKELGSQGEISSKIFLNAIEEGFGGAAQIMGDMSFSASFDNIGAAISRIGANFLDAGGKGGGFFSQLKPLMSEFRESLGVIEAQAADLGVAFGESFGNVIESMRSAIEWFNALDDKTRDTIKRTAGMGATIAVGLGPALKIIGSITSGLGSASAAGIGLVSMIGGLSTAGASAMGSVGSGMSKAFNKPLKSIASRVSDLKGSLNFSDIRIPNIFGKMIKNDTEAVSGLTEALRSIKGIDKTYSKRLVDSFGDDENFFERLQSYVDSPDVEKIKVPDSLVKSVLDSQDALEGMRESMDGLGESSRTTLGDLLGQFPGIGERGEKVISMFGTLKSASLSAASAVGTAALGIAKVTVSAIQMIMKASIASFSFAVLGGVVLAGMGAFYSKFQTEIDSVIDNIINKGPQLIEGFTNGVTSALPGLVNSGTALFSKIIELIVALGPDLLNAGMSIVTTLVQGVINNMPAITEGLAQLFSFLLSAIGNHLPTIIIMGAEVLLSFVQGMMANQDVLQEGLDAVFMGLGELIVTGLPLFFEIGMSMITLLVDGLIANMDSIIAIGVGLVSILALEILNNLPAIINAGMDILEALFNGIVNNWPLIKSAGKSIMSSLSNFLENEAPTLMARGLSMILWIAEGITENLDVILSTGFTIIAQLFGALIKGFWDNRMTLLHLVDVIAATLVGGLSQALLNGVAGIGEELLGTVIGWANYIPGINIKAPTFEKFDFYDPEEYKLRSRQAYGLDVNHIDNRSRGPNIIENRGGGVRGTPANINFNLGGREYNGFTEDIYDNTEQQIRLRNNY